MACFQFSQVVDSRRTPFNKSIHTPKYYTRFSPNVNIFFWINLNFFPVDNLILPSVYPLFHYLYIPTFPCQKTFPRPCFVYKRPGMQSFAFRLSLTFNYKSINHFPVL
jgi:hypothetical protein